MGRTVMRIWEMRTMQTADQPTTTPQTSASAEETGGTRTSSTAPSTGTATQRGEPTSSVRTGWCTSRTWSSATGQIESTVAVGLLVTTVMKTVIDVSLGYDLN